jgi:hypothetical protein
MFLLAPAEYANDKLRAHGYLNLNDVLDTLGFRELKPVKLLVGYIIPITLMEIITLIRI